MDVLLSGDTFADLYLFDVTSIVVNYTEKVKKDYGKKTDRAKSAICSGAAS